VVAHQAIGQQPEPELLPIVRQSPEVLSAIRIVSEDLLALIATHDDVVQRAGKLYAYGPGHLT
jgi:hypothetical protein